MVFIYSSAQLRSRLLWLLLTLATVAGCSGAPPVRRQVTGPMTPELAGVFDNGIDRVSQPDQLEGLWLQDWQRAMDLRITHADVVAQVTIQTLRTDVDLEQRETYRLIVHIENTLLGDGGGDITLTAGESDRGYGSVSEHARHLLEQQYMLFVKWESAGERIRARWHLSPPSEEVTSEVRNLLGRRRHVSSERIGRRRVIVREN